MDSSTAIWVAIPLWHWQAPLTQTEFGTEQVPPLPHATLVSGSQVVVALKTSCCASTWALRFASLYDRQRLQVGYLMLLDTEAWWTCINFLKAKRHQCKQLTIRKELPQIDASTLPTMRFPMCKQCCGRGTKKRSGLNDMVLLNLLASSTSSWERISEYQTRPNSVHLKSISCTAHDSWLVVFGAYSVMSVTCRRNPVARTWMTAAQLPSLLPACVVGGQMASKSIPSRSTSGFGHSNLDQG